MIGRRREDPIALQRRVDRARVGRPQDLAILANDKSPSVRSIVDRKRGFH